MNSRDFKKKVFQQVRLFTQFMIKLDSLDFEAKVSPSPALRSTTTQNKNLAYYQKVFYTTRKGHTQFPSKTELTKITIITDSQASYTNIYNWRRVPTIHNQN